MLNMRGLDIPFVSFGNVTSDNLFDEKEQAIFDFYEKSKDRYRYALDIGANIGVHALLMARNGWMVRAFEPDPDTYEILRKNIRSHKLGELICAEQAAISDHDAGENFVRVVNNRTGSHLEGDKEPYGPVEVFAVATVDCRELWTWADFAKIDCEGHEARLLMTVPEECKCEFMVEVGNIRNALAIYEHFYRLGVPMYSQKRDWQFVRDLKDMPKHHSEGSLFIGRKPPFDGA